MKTGIKVIDAMTQNPVMVNLNATLKQAANLMEEMHVGSLLVEENKKVVGILSEQDIVRKAVAQGTVGQFKVKNIMEEHLITISPEKDIFEAITVMRDHNIRHLPVMDQGKFYGLITTKDILRIEPDLFELLVERIELKEAERKPINRLNEKEGLCELCGQYSHELTEEEGSQMCTKCREL